MIKELLTNSYKDILYKSFFKKQEVYYNQKRQKKLRLVFVMDKTTVCGVAKIIFQHANILSDEGFDVSIVAHYPKPTWYPVNVHYIQAPVMMKLSKCIPDCDIIVATCYKHIGNCIQTGIAPVVYFEQGGIHIYNYNNYSKEVKEAINQQIQLAPFILTVSKQLAREIHSLFDKKAEVIHNAIDDEQFCRKASPYNRNQHYLLMMGSDGIYYKGIREIIAAYEMVKHEYQDLKLYWITPEIKDQDLLNHVSQVFIAPDQETIADLYRNAEIFISGSKYESFSLPVIEAMACGCPVITVENLGIKEYVVDTNNALIVPPHCPEILAEKIIYLLKNDHEKHHMIANALQTIKLFKYTATTDQLVRFYQSIGKYKLHYYNNLDEWNMMTEVSDFFHKSDYIKFIKMVLSSEASRIYLIRLYDIDGVSIGVWQVGAEKNESDNEDCCYCYVFAKGEGHTPLDTIFHKELDSFDLVESYSGCYSGDESERINHYRLTTYYLIRSELYREAKILLEEGLEQWEACTDLYLLYTIVLLKLGEIDRVSEIIETINIKERYSVETYFINNVVALAEKIVNGKIILPGQELKQLRKTSNLHYLADQLYNHGLFLDAIKYYGENMNQIKEDSDKYIATCRRIAMCYFFIEDYEMCRLSCFKAFQVSQPRAEESYLIGSTFHKEEKYDDAIFWYSLATRCQPPYNPSLFTQDKHSTFNPLLQLSLCYFEKGDYNKAFIYNEKAAEYQPDDKRIKANREIFRSKGLI
ncbi:glycosyltransferase family 4 protein [Vallitalea okinawensis]|uniref:glycosyltransferase family 4 protein n=1 Tax=Vallitalea okinawensis TaxID=2078660 RepID=UPI001478B222|nr:glycosyltransferase family 4 protein [Vallitalea okinawensis]